MSRRRLAVARLWLEVNSFSPLPTTHEDFVAKEWLKGPDALAPFAGTPTELGAVAAFAAARPDWEVVPLRCAAAEPGGPMDDDLFDAFLQELDRDLRAGAPWDAVYLSLHGALATARRPAPDLDIVSTVRAAAGAVPIGASLDMHGNLPPDMIRVLDTVAGYKTLPHVDMHLAAERVLGQLAAAAEGRLRPRTAAVHTGVILHSHNMATAGGPMRELEDFAAALVVPPVLDVSPFGGFPWADSPFTGASATAVADGDEAAAGRAATLMAEEIRRLGPRFRVVRPGPAEGLRQALALGRGPVVVQEPADNTYSGGIADTPELFRAMLDLAGEHPSVFAYFCDPPLVEKAVSAGVGTEIEAVLGGRVTGAFGSGVPVRGVVRRLTDGRFVNKGPMLQGVANRMGRSAVLRVRNVDVIVTERRQPVNDLAYLELHGIDLAAVRVFGVKAKNHFRAAFTPHCAAIIEVETPGPAAIDLSGLPYRYADPTRLA